MEVGGDIFRGGGGGRVWKKWKCGINWKLGKVYIGFGFVKVMQIR